RIVALLEYGTYNGRIVERYRPGMHGGITVLRGDAGSGELASGAVTSTVGNRLGAGGLSVAGGGTSCSGAPKMGSGASSAGGACISRGGCGSGAGGSSRGPSTQCPEGYIWDPVHRACRREPITSDPPNSRPTAGSDPCGIRQALTDPDVQRLLNLLAA